MNDLTGSFGFKDGENTVKMQRKEVQTPGKLSKIFIKNKKNNHLIFILREEAICEIPSVVTIVDCSQEALRIYRNIQIHE